VKPVRKTVALPFLAVGASVGGLVALVYVAFVRKPANHPRQFLNSGRRRSTETLVVCAGASLTHASLSGDYVAMLRDQLGGRGHEFVNAGVNGDTSRDLLLRLDEVVACRPDAVTILVGTNDARAALAQAATSEAFRANLQEILARLNAETDARIAVLSVPPLGEDHTSEANHMVARHNAAAKEVAAAHEAAYLPLGEELAALIERDGGRHPYRLRPTLMLANAVSRYVLHRDWDVIAAANGFAVLTDGIHLSDRGAAIAADLIARWLSRSTQEACKHAQRRQNDAEENHP
jgi:acyl-CoA thioesterase I